MKRNIRWSILMAVLGFILGLGFLVPLPGTETREPASADQQQDHGPRMTLIEPRYEEDPILPTGSVNELVQPKPVGQAFFNFAAAPVDGRVDVLFDIHTISKSKLAKDTDAYVVIRFTDDSRREIDRFTYCHNYDYEKQSANTKLGRFAPTTGSAGYKCYRLELTELKAGYTMIDAGAFGKVLVLQAKDFNPRTGGTISILYALKIAKIGKNDYRSIDMKLTLAGGKATIVGPKGESFDWLNLKMNEDVFNLPNGLSSFEFFKKGKSVKLYSGKDFPKVEKPK